jgi:adenine-specific DNA-methyltransferase
LADKLVHQRALKELQARRNEKRKDLFVAQDEVEARRDGLIAGIGARMGQSDKVTHVFTVRWVLEG